MWRLLGSCSPARRPHPPRSRWFVCAHLGAESLALIATALREQITGDRRERIARERIQRCHPKHESRGRAPCIPPGNGTRPPGGRAWLGYEASDLLSAGDKARPPGPAPAAWL